MQLLPTCLSKTLGGKTTNGVHNFVTHKHEKEFLFLPTFPGSVNYNQCLPHFFIPKPRHFFLAIGNQGYKVRAYELLRRTGP